MSIQIGIDQIFEMFLSDDENVQQRGIEYAKEIQHLSVFLQPLENKSLWWCCAEVLASKSDEKLQLYFYDMFVWLQDMCWPGADTIYNRLLSVPTENLRSAYNHCLREATLTNDEPWREELLHFWSEKTS